MGLFSRNSRRVIFGHPEVDKQIHFLETEQRLCPKLVELMEGFLRMENKTKISATHQLAAQKHISKKKEGHFQEYYNYCRKVTILRKKKKRKREAKVVANYCILSKLN